ncbi:hypothetical protein [Nocardia brasiliensis]|uniref:hypothetical protein n=1 Tax=Nocardia brasiliensis TaxID=37326 RepID=UPI002457BF1A|nr:hypothetical protein [Nocardia brasiliensis]
MSTSPALPSVEQIETALERAYDERDRCDGQIATLSKLGIAAAARQYVPTIRWVVLIQNVDALTPVALCDGRGPDIDIHESSDPAVHSFGDAIGALAANITDPETAGLTLLPYNLFLLDLTTTATDLDKSWFTTGPEVHSVDSPARAGEPAEFSVDETAFAAWITDETVLDDAPTPASDAPASDLLSLLDSALRADVVVGASRWELLLDVDNAPRDPGFHLILRARDTDHITVGYTLGFTRMDDLGTDTDSARADTVRRHLDHVIAVANTTLASITGRE